MSRGGRFATSAVVLAALRKRVRAGASDDSGAVAIIVAVLMFVFLGLCAIAVDLGAMYVEGERLQKIADAAAAGGVTYMPQDLPSARSAAQDVARRNGGVGGFTLVAEPGRLPSQLKVTVTSSVGHNFATLFGITSSTLSRTSTADFQDGGAAPMASPCNTFGMEPPGSSLTPDAPPAGSSQPVPPVPGCENSNTGFWASVQGPNTNKTYGDRYMTRRCSSGTDGCDGTVNREFDPEGYFYAITVTDPAATGPLRIQLYDPAWIDTESDCSGLPSLTWISSAMNGWTTDARERYKPDNNRFCTGDYAFGSGRIDTSFALRAPTDSLDPRSAPPIAGCTVQFKGREDEGWGWFAADLKKTNEMTRVLHQWVPLCTIPNPIKGTYYLQVRTNVALPSMSSSQFIARGNTTVTDQKGDNTAVQGNGTNAFGIRAVSNDGRKVSVSAIDRMSMSVNEDDQTSNFNLIKALPGAAGQTIKFSIFDAADHADGYLTITPPNDARTRATIGTTLQGCRGEGAVTGPLSNCRVRIRDSTHTSKVQTIYVPLPPNYSCDYELPGGCWFRVNIQLDSGKAEDTTTWTGDLLGDPVRLVP